MKYFKYSTKYKAQVVDLLNICFPQRRITPESFEWKHLKNISSKNTLVYIAKEKNKVVSFVCFNPLLVNNNGNCILFYSCTVQATHPDFRRRGIVSKLTVFVEKELGLNANYFGFSNLSGVKIDLYSKTINYQILGRLVTKYFLALKFKNSLSIKEVSFKQFTNRNFNTISTEIDKNKKYLEWKFVNNPKRNYNFATLNRGVNNIGRIIFTETRTKIEIYLIKLKQFSMLKEVIRSLQTYALGRGKLFVSFTYLNNDLWKKYMPKGYLKKSTNIYFTVKSADKKFLDKENWLIQGGDIQ